MSEEQREVYRQHRVAQDKYEYFLLAAAAAAIALAVNQTQTAQLSWSQLPLGGAVLCWGLSFFLGCRYLAYTASTLHANAELLRVEAGQQQEVGTDPERIGAASAGIRQAIARNAKRADRLGRWQFRLLVIGAILYVTWHVWEMWLRTARSAV